jgi:hypothetical protein
LLGSVCTTPSAEKFCGSPYKCMLLAQGVEFLMLYN